MSLIAIVFCGLILALNILSFEANGIKGNAQTLRDELLRDVFIIKDGTERLQIAADILGKRSAEQLDILKKLQNNFLNSPESPENVIRMCDSLTGTFNITFRKYSGLEGRMLAKLEEIQEDQNTRHDEILLKLKLNKNCTAKVETASTAAILFDTLTEVSDKINTFEGQFVRLAVLDKKLTMQHNKLKNFAENQIKILKEISDKLTKNQGQFEKFSQELASLRQLETNINQVITNPRPKLPMEVILGLTSANVTSFK